MGNANSSDDDKERAATLPERKLRGSALGGSDQKSAPDHTTYEERRNPDTELHLDEEKDSLYDDGLDIDDDDSDDTLAGTRGNSSGIKP